MTFNPLGVISFSNTTQRVSSIKYSVKIRFIGWNRWVFLSCDCFPSSLIAFIVKARIIFFCVLGFAHDQDNSIQEMLRVCVIICNGQQCHWAWPFSQNTHKMIAVFLPCAFGLLNAGRQRDFNNYCMKSFYVHNFDVKHRKNCECCPGHYLSTSVY